MAGFLLYHKKTRPTGRAIAEALGFRHGADPAAIPADTETVIRWGNAKRIARGNARVINEARSIMLAGDKLETLKKLRAEGIPSLEFYETFPVAVHGTWFCRKRRGFGGRDIFIAYNLDGNPIMVYPNNMNERELPNAEATAAIDAADFFTKAVDNSKEYRIHVVGGEIIRFQRKYYEGPPHQVGHRIRVQNHANGYKFKQPNKKLNKDRFEAATRAVEALGLDFGAVDLVVDPRTNRPVILEVNTAASCSPRTLNAYVEAFRKELA